jgi:hypothetical protein
VNSGELEAKIKALAATIEQQAAKLKSMEKVEARLTVLEDIEAIKKLQRAYSYYLEHWQEEQIIGLFSRSNDVSVEIHDSGLYKGCEAVKKSFHFPVHYTAFSGEKTAPPEFLHVLMGLQGIVDLEPDGRTAKGRWYGLGLVAMPRGGKLRAMIATGIWENEYVKEEGIWKILKLFYNVIFSCPIEEGWVKTPYLPNPPNQDRPPMGPNTHPATYPSGYIFPYHYKNPVTGK